MSVLIKVEEFQDSIFSLVRVSTPHSELRSQLNGANKKADFTGKHGRTTEKTSDTHSEIWYPEIQQSLPARKNISTCKTFKIKVFIGLIFLFDEIEAKTGEILLHKATKDLYRSSSESVKSISSISGKGYLKIAANPVRFDN